MPKTRGNGKFFKGDIVAAGARIMQLLSVLERDHRKRMAA